MCGSVIHGEKREIVSMNGMKEREEAFEEKYVLDEELRFKADAQRNRKLGLWAANRLGKSGEEADNYAKEIIWLSIQYGGEDEVIAKIIYDFRAKNISDTEDDVRKKMAQLLQESLLSVQIQK